MNPTRRAFLGSAARAVLAPAAGAAMLGCANSAHEDRKRATEPSTRAVTRTPIRPPKGQVLFIAGQESAHLGGRPDEDLGDGYLDHVAARPGGFTLYSSIAVMPNFPELGRVSDLPALRDSVLHLSISWVADFDWSTKGNNQAITTGAFDENIRLLAIWCAAQPRPILLRIGYEFDREVPFPNFHYDLAYFAQAFRRIVDRFRAEGAGNVYSVLASTNAPGFSPVLSTETFNRFYPGDDYVDWLGCSMWHPTDVDQVILSEARRRNKPVLLAETTPVKYNIGESAYYPAYMGLSQSLTAQAIWDGWHQPMIDFMRANSDVIAAWHYIAADWAADPNWKWIIPFMNCDARPWATPEFLEIWNRHMNAAPLLQGSASLFRELGYAG
jgi:hypothetical protein